ncbi:MAG: hypothetical protein ABL936_19795 [Aestuariivirga sp.]
MGIVQKVLGYFKSSTVWREDIHCVTGARIRLEITKGNLGTALILRCNEGEDGGRASIRMNRKNANKLIENLKEALLAFDQLSKVNSVGGVS